MARAVMGVALALGLLAGACSSGEGGDGGGRVGKPASISHIHGLGIDRAGTLYVATHHGLIKAGGNEGWVYASSDTYDHMGFSLHPGDGVMYRSGHSPSKPSLGVQSSSDGARWTHLSDVADPPVDFHAMTVSFADSRALWGWDSGGRGTFRSTDGAKTWTRLGARSLERQIYVLAGTADRDAVFAGTASGLYRSPDDGESWEPIEALSGGWVTAVASAPTRSTHMLAFTHRGMRATTDGGARWVDAGAGLPANARITSVAMAAADADVAYAADSSQIYRTVDGGRSWTLMGAT